MLSPLGLSHKANKSYSGVKPTKFQTKNTCKEGLDKIS